MYINCIRALVLNWLFWALSTSFIPTIAGCTFVCIRSCYMGQMIAFFFFFTHFNSYPRSAACYAFLSPAFFANANRCWCLIDQGEHLIFFYNNGFLLSSAICLRTDNEKCEQRCKLHILQPSVKWSVQCLGEI